MVATTLSVFEFRFRFHKTYPDTYPDTQIVQSTFQFWISRQNFFEQIECFYARPVGRATG